MKPTPASRSSWHRQVDGLLRSLGYRFDRMDSHSHSVYIHPQGWVWRVPSTPSDHRTHKIMLQQLRRRHPDAEVLRRPRKAPTKARQAVRQARRSRRALRIVSATATRVKPVVSRPSRTACVDCGRRWLSDLDPTGRKCPACGGNVVLGRDRDGVTLRLAA